MKKKVGIILSATLLFMCFNIKVHAQFGQKSKPIDTTGLYDIEDKLTDFKSILEGMTNQINRCGNLDSIKRFTGIIQSIDDTLISHLAPIFDGFWQIHPNQYAAMKNISDISDHIMTAKNLDKVKKLNQKMLIEYTSLANAK